MNPATPRSSAARAFALAFGLVAALAADADVRAEGAGQPGNAEQVEKDARRLFQKAELSFNVGKFAEALADYQAAYEAKPLPGFLFNIAQCYRNMGDYEHARFFFRRYLTLDPRTPNRRRVEALIDEMTRKLAEKPAAPPATAEEHKTVEEPKAVDAPKAAEEPPPPPPVAPATTATTAAPLIDSAPAPAPSSEERPVWKRWWFWTAAAVVVAGGAAAAFVLTRPEARAPGTLDPIDGR